MLLRQPEPADADHYISAVSMGSPGATQDMTTPATTTTAATPRADLLDDVFGSDDGGEDHHDHDQDPDPDPDPDPDDNPDEPQAPRYTSSSSSSTTTRGGHPSDMYRLRREHRTAGYREGITAAKAASVQAGFDEGFGLGATIGLRVGYLLGVLEGIAAAAGSREAGGQLLSGARAELDLRSVFGGEYWNPDGTWRYEVAAGVGGGDGDDVLLFSHVAEAHPLVRKWAPVVEGEMRRWGLEEQLALLRRRDEGDGEAEAEAEAEAVARVKPVVVVTQGQADAKAAGGGALSW